MENESIIETKVLGQLLLMQNILTSLPNEKSIFGFVCAGLVDIPGINSAHYLDTYESYTSNKAISLPIGNRDEYFGSFQFKLSNIQLFKPYEHYLQNFIFMLQIVLKERKQKRINELHKLELEKRVKERTKQLSEEIEVRKLAEVTLQKSILFQEKMVSNIGDVIVIIDVNGINKFKSPNIETHFGWKPSEVIGKSTWDLVHPDDIKTGQEFMSSLRNANDKGTTQLKYKRKNGSYCWIEITVVNLLHDPVINGFLGNYHDITLQIEVEHELHEAKEKAEKSDRLKSAFLANMSHEIRTPMNGILGFTELLKEAKLTGKEQEKYISVIEISGQRLLSTVNDLIDFSKIEAGQMKVITSEFDLNKLCQQLFTFFNVEAQKKGLELLLSTRSLTKAIILQSDQEKIYSILTNLIKNAIKFTQKGSIDFGYQKKRNELKFHIKDTGKGIPKERLEVIFDRFIRVEDLGEDFTEGGSGLGLSISKAYIEMLGGKIWVESEAGVGSQFYFTIPYQESESKKSEGS